MKRDAYAKTNNVEPGQTEAGSGSVFNRGQVVSKYGITRLIHRRTKRGGGQGGQAPPKIREGGGNIPFGPPNNPPTFSFNFYVKQEKFTNIRGGIKKF